MNNPCKYNYGFRQLDPQICRWHVVDAMAEKYLSISPYAYVGNEPVNRTDFLGLTFYYKRIEWEIATQNAFRGGGGGGSGFLSNLERCRRYGQGDLYDTQYFVNSTHSFGQSFGDWYNEHQIAAVKAGYNSVKDALRSGYFIYIQDGWKKMTSTKSNIVSPFSKKGDVNVREVIIMEIRKYRIEFQKFLPDQESDFKEDGLGDYKNGRDWDIRAAEWLRGSLIDRAETWMGLDKRAPYMVRLLIEANPISNIPLSFRKMYYDYDILTEEDISNGTFWERRGSPIVSILASGIPFGASVKGVKGWIFSDNAAWLWIVFDQGQGDVPYIGNGRRYR